MSFTDWKTAVEPKVNGNWNLHDASSQCELDLFLLFSSYAGFGGYNGQDNYAGGNTVLDVGVMADVGFVSRDARLLERFEKTVMRSVREQDIQNPLLLSMQRFKPSKHRAQDHRTVYKNPTQILLGLVTNIPISSPQIGLNGDTMHA